ncbi:substrate-binding domain-containing protein [Hespellia stercorisuis]|uniref:AI-2 transport system substrate-binding protein n=1 Tax=Hespellia stercorisuis DSM 15480 TaxID=1121950 RepID=A0A1M6J5W3_9FIRM|nr:substrate-binding domain-containing protein [Hespellia stercorisuis]SHJ42078.1 AI-2 transport system substrate-binding protein [Hespellia stercorisuis DSM 15480]
MKKKLISALLCVAMVATMVAGCGSKETSGGSDSSASAASGDEKLIVFVPKVTGNSFFESANDGAQEFAKKVGKFTINYDGSATAAVADQVTIINNAITQGADGIAVSSVDATGLDEVLKKAQDAGLSVVTWDSDVTADARQIMVSQGSPEILGEFLVQLSEDALKASGKDPAKDDIKYCWHYSQATVTDQNSWHDAAEKVIAEKYPNWENVAPDNYYSEQDAEKAISVGESVLTAHDDINLIICNDSTALPGQAQAAQNLGKTVKDVAITGFATPNAMKDYCTAGIVNNWGLWDTGLQGSIACYMAYYLADGNKVTIGDKIDIPEIGEVEIVNNSEITGNDSDNVDGSGVVFLPERAEFTADNMNDYDF